MEFVGEHAVLVVEDSSIATDWILIAAPSGVGYCGSSPIEKNWLLQCLLNVLGFPFSSSSSFLAFFEKPSPNRAGAAA